MSDEKQVQNNTAEEVPTENAAQALAPETKTEATATVAPEASVEKTVESEKKEEPKRATKRNFRSKAPARGGSRQRVKPEFDQKIISLRRVVRVMGGGRRFSFSVAMVLGDKQGRVGFGVAKAGDTSQAIQKAVLIAKQNLVKLQLTDDQSLPHEVAAKFNSARITLRPNFGRGLVSGSAVRTILELAGVKNVTSRVLSRSRNQINNARAALAALEPFIVARGTDAQKKPTSSQAQSSAGNTNRRHNQSSDKKS